MRIHSVTDPRICSIRLPDMRVVELKVTYKGLECECQKLKKQVMALPDLMLLLLYIKAGNTPYNVYEKAEKIFQEINAL